MQRLVGLALGLALSPACAPPAPVPAPAAPSLVELPAPPPCARIATLRVYKRERVLLASCARGAHLEMTAAIGRGAPGPKRARGDLRTPEGRYHVAGPPRASRFHLFVPIDYPAPSDAEAALAEGRLSARDHARILEAHEERRLPPQDTPLGGGIGLHGEGARWRGSTAELNWTLGCVAVRDSEIERLAALLEIGTPVEILP